MKVHLIERVLAHGTGVGERRVIGRVRRLTPPFDPALRVDPDEIVVTPHTDRTCVAILRRAAGLVTAATAQDAHCRLLAMEMGIPAVVGIREGVEALPDGMQVVLDAKRGVVYDRRADQGRRRWCMWKSSPWEVPGAWGRGCLKRGAHS